MLSMDERIVPIQNPGGKPNCQHLFEWSDRLQAYKCVANNCGARLTEPLPKEAIRRGNFVVWVGGA